MSTALMGLGLRIRLVTREDDLVGIFEIPPFQKPPEVVVWGGRVFELDVEKFDDPEDGAACQYRECFMYVIPPGQEIISIEDDHA